MQLTKNISLSELIASQTAARYNVDNTPTDAVINNLRTLAIKVLQPVRDHFKQPLIITSGYRCPKLNHLIKSKPTSQHIKGMAADFHVLQHSNEEVIRFIEENLTFDQLINEYAPNGWIHVSYNANHNRQQSFAIN